MKKQYEELREAVKKVTNMYAQLRYEREAAHTPMAGAEELNASLASIERKWAEPIKRAVSDARNKARSLQAVMQYEQTKRKMPEDLPAVALATLSGVLSGAADVGEIGDAAWNARYDALLEVAKAHWDNPHALRYLATVYEGNGSSSAAQTVRSRIKEHTDAAKVIEDLDMLTIRATSPESPSVAMGRSEYMSILQKLEKVFDIGEESADTSAAVGFVDTGSDAALRSALGLPE